MVLTPLVESEYIKTEATVLFVDEQYNRKFMAIDTEYGLLKFGWNSEFVVPSVTEINQDLLSVGVDLHFVLYSISINKVVVSLSLDSFFCSIKVFNHLLFVAAETELYEVNLTLFSVKKIALPDIFSGFSINDGKLNVSFLNGDSMTVSVEKKDVKSSTPK